MLTTLSASQLASSFFVAEGQGVDRADELLQLKLDPAEHVKTVKGRLEDLDKSIQVRGVVWCARVHVRMSVCVPV